jgi:steroid delta-isomerase-like uncharacterized protein
MTGDPLVKRLIDAIRARDAAEFGACYADNAVLIEPLFDRPHVGREEIVAGEQALFDAFTEIEVQLGVVLADGHRRAVELVMRATNTGSIDLPDGMSLPATGRRIELPMAWLLDLNDDGLITSERDYFDTATLMQQLGGDG